MHIIALNLLDLLLGLWRGTIDFLTRNTWKVHGLSVAQCRQYFPGLFDCPPRNPAEKINSGYKAWEFLLYSIHALSQLSPDTVRLGPGGYSSRWTLEHMIGNLGEELKQPSNPYTNLANCGLRQSQMAALHAMLPDLDSNTLHLPRGAVDLGEGYILLRAQDEHGVVLRGKQADALHMFTTLKTGNTLPDDWEPKYIHWAHLQLPNLQIACCAWKETEHASAAEHVRHSQNVKFTSGGLFHIGEVQFYFRRKHNGVERTHALISVWSKPNPQLLEESSQAIYACAYQGQDSLQWIQSNVGPLATSMQAGSLPLTTITAETLNDLLQLLQIRSQKTIGFSEVHANAMDSSTSDSAGFQSLDRNIHLSPTSSSALPTGTSLLLPPFEPAMNGNPSHIAYSLDSISSGGHSLKYQVLCDATHEDLLATQNQAYMRIQSEYTKVTPSFTTLEYYLSHCYTQLSTNSNNNSKESLQEPCQ
ncbi:hypothetical protein EI94DRAFT_1706629 [Lactarius quietus]|nr:hypothetical protein EI94DRAFT_1706629 [Lactarius quietus]